MLIDQRVDFDKKRNLMIASVILVLGIGGAIFNYQIMCNYQEWHYQQSLE